MSMRSPTSRPVVVTGGHDATVRVWDLDARGLLYQPLQAHRGKVNAVVVGDVHDRPIAVSASDFTLRVWDLEAGGPLGRPLEGHDNIVNAVAVGQLDDRPIAVSGGCDQLVRVWDLAAGGPFGEPLAHDRFVNEVAVGELHDRSLAASGDAGETVRPVVAMALPGPGGNAAMTLGSRIVDQGGSAGSEGAPLGPEGAGRVAPREQAAWERS